MSEEMTHIVICPAPQDIVKRAAEVMPVFENDLADVVILFATKVGGERKNALGINMAWEFALKEIVDRPGSVPYLRGIMNQEFVGVMMAVFYDQEAFLTRVLEIRAQVIDRSKLH